MAFCLGLSALWAEDPNPSKFVVLDNGLRVFLYEKHDLPLFNMTVAIDLGSKDETDETNGLVHILEHCVLFRGTARRSGSDVLGELRRHGAVVNAHTGQDMSLYEISLPAEHADFALRNEKEILFEFAIGQEELDAEAAVILEEMNQLEDDPMKSGLDLVFRHLFKGHPYGRSVYGRKDVVRTARAEDLRAFHRRYFVPNNCAMAVVGDFLIPDMERKIRAIFSPLERAELPPRTFVEAPLLRRGEEVEREMDINQAYLFIGFVGPDYNSPDQFAMDVLVEMMGKGIHPLLNSALRSRRNLVQTVDMLFFSNRFGGASVATMSLDPKNLTAVAREAVEYLKRASNENFSKDDYTGDQQFYVFDFLESAKNQIRFSVQRNLELGRNLAMSFARYMLLSDRPGEISYLEEIGALRSTDLRKVAATYLGKGEPVIVSLIPRKDAK
jgi:predicted Zn-dependent peptidase